MVSKILQKANECANPTADDQADAIKLLLKKHNALVGTNFDPNSHVYDGLVSRKLQTIDDYDVAMSAITKELETASYVSEKMEM